MIVRLAVCLTLGACSSTSRDWRAGVPPPPAAEHELDEPARSVPVLASTYLGLAVPPTTVANPPTVIESELLAVFEGWREAWMAGDFPAFLRHYAPAYAGNDTPALRWQTRRLRMVQGRSGLARLDFGPPSLDSVGEAQARISFAQTFRDGELDETGTKQWQLRRVDGRWLIEQEIFERRAP